MWEWNVHEIGVGIFVTASVLSLILLIIKTLGKEVESTVVVWIRVWKRIRVEREKVTKPNEMASQQPRTSIETESKSA